MLGPLVKGLRIPVSLKNYIKKNTRPKSAVDVVYGKFSCLRRRRRGVPRLKHIRRGE